MSYGGQGKHYLHGHEPIIDKNLLGEEVGADSCLVAPAELLVDLLTRNDDASVIS